MDEALGLYRRMQESKISPNWITYSLVLGLQLREQKRWSEAQQVLVEISNRLRKGELKLNSVVFADIARGCVKAKAWVLTWKLLEASRPKESKGGVPMEVWSAAVAGLVETGR